MKNKILGRSLQKLLTLNFILTAVIPLLVVGAITLLLLDRSITQQVMEKDMRLARSVAAEADDYLHTAVTAIAQVAYITDMTRELPEDVLKQYLNKVLMDYPMFEGFQIVNSQGIVRITAPYDENYNGISVSRQPFFMRTQETGQTYLSSPFLSAQTGQPTMTITKVTNDGMVVGYLSLVRLSDICKRGIAGDGSGTAILDTSGTVIGHSDHEQVYQRTNMGNLDFLQQVYQGHEGNFRYEQKEERFLISAASIPYNGWPVIVFQKERDALSAVRHVSVFFIYGLLLALVGAMVISIASANRIMRPLRQLTEGTQLVASGDYESTIEPGRYQEFITLADHFTTMKRAVQTRESELLDQKQALGKSLQAVEDRNRELDQFAYVVSHDLKAPLRAISNLSQWIQEDHIEIIQGDIKEKIDLIRSRVYRMENMIEGILQCSRIGRVLTSPERVHIGQLVDAVIQDAVSTTGFSISRSPDMPILVTDRVRLEQVFSNLIGNAVKHHHRLNGRIEILMRNEENGYTFSVTDDGPGIAPQYHKKVFEIFQTLQARDVMDNTGVGLALVKKIVEDKGGRIWLESDVGQGTTVYFTWFEQASH